MIEYQQIPPLTKAFPTFSLDFIPYPLLAGLLILAMILASLRMRKRSLAFLLGFTLFYGYLLAVAAIIFFPITVPDGWPGNITAQNALFTLAHINLIPFNFGDLFSANAWTIFIQLAGNILLTLPFGFAMPFLARISPHRLFWLALSAGFALEGAQLAFELTGLVSAYGHSVDINDVLLNAAGVLVGYGLFGLAARLKREFTKDRRLRS